MPKRFDVRRVIRENGWEEGYQTIPTFKMTVDMLDVVVGEIADQLRGEGVQAETVDRVLAGVIERVFAPIDPQEQERLSLDAEVLAFPGIRDDV